MYFDFGQISYEFRIPLGFWYWECKVLSYACTQLLSAGSIPVARRQNKPELQSLRGSEAVFCGKSPVVPFTVQFGKLSAVVNIHQSVSENVVLGLLA